MEFNEEICTSNKRKWNSCYDTVKAKCQLTEIDQVYIT